MKSKKISKVIKVLAVGCITIQLAFTSTIPTMYASSAQSNISINSGVQVSLYDAQLTLDETGKLAAFTIKINNNSNATVNLIDYWARIKGSNNRTYVTKLITEDMEKKYVIPKTTTYLTYYAYVDQNETLSNLKLDFIEWDFSQPNYESTVGSIKVAGNGKTSYQSAEEINLDKNLLNVLLGNYAMYSDPNYTYLSFDVAIRNKANSTVNANKLKFYISDGKGSLIELSNADLSLKPQERKTISLSSTVTNDFITEDASIVLMYNDESASLNIPKATFTLPKLQTTKVKPINVESIYSINNTSIGIVVKDSSLSSSNNKSSLQTTVVLENKGNASIEIPKLEYYAKTAEGYLYPLLLSNDEDQKLLPKIKKEVKIEGEIPNGINLKTSEIVLFNKSNEEVNSHFLGNYSINLGTSQTDSSQTAKKATYNKMEIEQTSLQRTPNGLNDLLIAEFKITNKDTVGKGKLNISGAFELDGVKLNAENTKIFALDNLVAVSPGQSYRVIAYTEIPYVQEAKTIVFNMNEKVDSGVKDIQSFEVSRLSNARLLAVNENYTIDTLGNRGEIEVLDGTIYEGKQSNLFVTKLLFTNKEKRTSLPAQLKGYIENNKQDIVDLDIKNYASRLLPNGQVILYASAQIPQNYEDKKINIYFGEGIGGNEEGLESVIVNPVYTSINLVTETVQDSLREVPFMGYDYTMYNIETGIDSSDGWAIDTITLNFRYDLISRDDQTYYADVEKLIVEYVDADVAAVAFSKTFELNGEAGTDALKIGRNNVVSMKYTHPVVQNLNLRDYKINIYTEYKGHKKLVASNKLSFGTVN